MKNPLSLRLLYLLTRISYWGLISITVIVVFAGTIMITLDPQLMKLGFSSNLTHVEEVVYLNSETGIPVEVEFSAESIGVPVKYLDKPTMAYVLIMLLMWLTCVTFIARFFKKFMKKVLEGQTFQSESILLLKKAALGFVILKAIDLVTYVTGHVYVQRNFDLIGFEHKFDMSLFPSTAIILALTLWVLAHIFQKGKELEDEQKFTV